jgi:hypothetical protein
MLMRQASTVGFQQTLPLISGWSSAESRSGDTPEEELNVPTEGWNMGVPIGNPCDVMAER